MGQYYKLVNATKKQYIRSWDIACGAKLWEWCANRAAGIFPYLLRKSTGLGGGDPVISVDWLNKDQSNKWRETFRNTYPLCGSWAGDSVYLIGDYDDDNPELYYVEDNGEWTDISSQLTEEYNHFIEVEDLKIGERERNTKAFPVSTMFIKPDGIISSER